MSTSATWSSSRSRRDFLTARSSSSTSQLEHIGNIIYVYHNTLYFLLNLPARTQWQWQSHENIKVKDFLLPNPPSYEDNRNNTCSIFPCNPFFLKTVKIRGEILGTLLQAWNWSDLSAPLSSSLQTSTLPWSAAYITAFFPALKYFQEWWWLSMEWHSPFHKLYSFRVLSLFFDLGDFHLVELVQVDARGSHQLLDNLKMSVPVHIWSTWSQICKF